MVLQKKGKKDRSHIKTKHNGKCEPNQIYKYIKCKWSKHLNQKQEMSD